MKIFLTFFILTISLSLNANERDDKAIDKCTAAVGKIGAEASTYVKPIPNETKLINKLRGSNKNQRQAISALTIAFIASECRKNPSKKPLSIAIEVTKLIQIAAIIYERAK